MVALDQPYLNWTNCTQKFKSDHKITILIIVCEEKQNKAKEKSFYHCWYHYFRALKLELLPLCPFSKPIGGKYFLKFVRGGRNIEWMREMYIIGPQKLFLFLIHFVYSRYTLFLSQNFYKLSQLELKWPWSCRSNLQKCLERSCLTQVSEYGSMDVDT